MQIPATILLSLKQSPFTFWVLRLGGVGLLFVGVVDNSAVPLPSGMDLLTIWLAAGHGRSWAYYAIMATVGSIAGAYITYRLGKKGGKEALEKKLPRKKVEQGYKRFEKWGFWSVLAATLMPPPFPIAAAWLTVGALRYSATKFLIAVASGRAVRYGIIAYVANRYGAFFLSTLSRYYKPAFAILVGFLMIAGFHYLRRYRQLRREKHLEDQRNG
jgi:membrane protein YqaA with SNARE-associated domain